MECDEIVMDRSKRPAFTEVIQFDDDGAGRPAQLLNVRIMDELETKQQILVYCTDVGSWNVKYKLTLSSSEIDSAVSGGVDQPMRRLCRGIIAQLKLSGGALSLAVPQVEQETPSSAAMAEERLEGEVAEQIVINEDYGSADSDEYSSDDMRDEESDDEKEGGD